MLPVQNSTSQACATERKPRPRWPPRYLFVGWTLPTTDGLLCRINKLCPVTRDVTPHLRPTASSHPAPSSRGVGAELYCDHASLTLVSADAARWQLKWTADHPRRKGIYRVVPLRSSVTWLYINCITRRKLYHVNFHEIMGIVWYGTSRCGFGILSYTPV